MALECGDNLALLVSLHLHHADVSIGATNGYIACVSVESNALSYCVARVDLHYLLDHADVPGLEQTVGIARSNVVAAHREYCILNCIQMAVECLHSEPRTHVPN